MELKSIIQKILRLGTTLEGVKSETGKREKKRYRSVHSVNILGKPTWTGHSYAELVQEGYKKNVIVYRCVTLIARSLASVAFLLKKGVSPLDTHPLLTLLSHPNPLRGGASFVEALVSHLLLSGNAYVEAMYGFDEQPCELYLLRPDRVEIVPATTGQLRTYKYTVDEKTRRISMLAHNGKRKIAHIKLFNPIDDWYGASPLNSAACAIDQHNAVAEHNLSLLQNGGRPSGVAVFRDGLDEDSRELAREHMTSFHQGPGNAGRMMIVEGDVEWKEMGLSPREMDFATSKDVSAREIAQAFGVPAMLVGVKGDSTYANYREARFHLWEDTILPLLDMIVDELNSWLTPQFGPDLQIGYDQGSIPALSQRREQLWQSLERATFLTDNEKRAATGYPPHPLSRDNDGVCAH
ncbi:MAG: phage portal protein [Alphaproteobacteria bacterium]|nr:MAG: phage portal protein [Alphaproteobacteria bacterium]